MSPLSIPFKKYFYDIFLYLSVVPVIFYFASKRKIFPPKNHDIIYTGKDLRFIRLFIYFRCFEIISNGKYKEEIFLFDRHERYFQHKVVLISNVTVNSHCNRNMFNEKNQSS